MEQPVDQNYQSWRIASSFSPLLQKVNIITPEAETILIPSLPPPPTFLVRDLVQFINSKMLRPEDAPLFIYVDNEIVVSPENSMAKLYQEHREDDFFLYLAYYEENIHRHLEKYP